MKKLMKMPNIAVRLALTLIVGTVLAISITTMQANAEKKAEAVCKRLGKMGNCQADVLAPFIVEHNLHSIPVSNPNDFEGFIGEQVARGNVSTEDAQQVFSAINDSDGGKPVYSEKGWVLSGLQ